MAPRFKIGTKFTPNGKNYVCTVTDVLTTRNSKGEVVKIRYEATHGFMGQTLTEHDVLETTIARGLLEEGGETDAVTAAPAPAQPLTPYFCRLRGLATGLIVHTPSRNEARCLFAAHQGIDPKNSYIVVSDTRAQGVLFTDIPTE